MTARGRFGSWIAKSIVAQGRRVQDRGDLQSAINLFQLALRWIPESHDARLALSIALRRSGQTAEAFAHLQALGGEQSADPRVVYQMGGLRFERGEYGDALSCFDAALASDPSHIDAAFNRALTLLKLARFQQALDVLDQLSAACPRDAEIQRHRGSALSQLNRHREAMAALAKALELKPDDADTLFNQSVMLLDSNRPVEAIASLRKLLQVAPNYPWARGKLLHAMMWTCEWEGLESLIHDVQRALELGEPAAEPFCLLAATGDPQILQQSARLYSRYLPAPPQAVGFAPAQRDLRTQPEPGSGHVDIPPADRPDRSSPDARPTKLRIGYVSGEFRQQATSVLAVDLFECHDRDRFSIIAFDNGVDDRSPMRRRLTKAFDEWVPIADLNDEAASHAVRQSGVDILVDLNGFFGRARPGLFSRRSAPIQVNYLGFPGTLGSPGVFDYLLADRWVVPDDHLPFYDEKVVRLPVCYQVNDRFRSKPAVGLSRAHEGLPEDDLVLCCFNNPYKITPAIFDIWMELLKICSSAVLWLLEHHPSSSRALQRQAQQRDIDPRRLRFAPASDYPTYLARMSLADLFLDTHPCSAHTTASDALWAGLPLLTCEAGGFAGRVAGSVLRAAGMTEGITLNLRDYRRKAIEWVTDPNCLQKFRSHGQWDIKASPLLDTVARTRDIEAAFMMMDRSEN